MILNALDRKPLRICRNGGQVRDRLHVTGHCEAIWTLIDEGRIGETHHVGGNEERRNIGIVKELCRVVAEETGAPLDEWFALTAQVEDRPGHDQRHAIDASKNRKE
jgi:dTDP-glucose 4,6-dehydratase